MNELKVDRRGPCIVEEVVRLCEHHRLTSSMIAERYGVGSTWYSQLKSGHVKNPSARVVQVIIEDLTGKALLGNK